METEQYRQSVKLINNCRKDFGILQGFTTRRLNDPRGDLVMDKELGYLDLLPKFCGLNFVEWIRRKISETGKPLRLLDIGCGAGYALLDLRKMFSVEELEISGVGNVEAIQKEIPDTMNGLVYESTEVELTRSKVKFLNENVIDLHNILDASSYDIILSLHAFDWIIYPKMLLLKEVWNLLKQDGIAFLSPIDLCLCLPNNTFTSAFYYLRDHYGILLETNNESLSIQRNVKDFPDIFEIYFDNFSNTHVFLNKQGREYFNRNN